MVPDLCQLRLPGVSGEMRDAKGGAGRRAAVGGGSETGLKSLGVREDD